MNPSIPNQPADLIDAHGRMVFGTAYRIVGNAEDAEDVMQDVFLKVLNDWNKKLNPENVRDWGAYLRVTTTRRAIDQLRRRRKVRQTSDGIEMIEAPALLNPRNQAIQGEQAGLLREALRQLPRRQAYVFTLHHIEAMSYEQIAAHTSMSVNGVGVILHRARGRLRSLLEKKMDWKPRIKSLHESGTQPSKEGSHVA